MSALEQTVQADHASSWPLVALGLVVFVFVLANVILAFWARSRIRRACREGGAGSTAELRQRIDRLGAGEAAVLASRSPLHAARAEGRSAAARWSHVGDVFPRIVLDASNNSQLLLVRVEYTDVDAVKSMQAVLGSEIERRIDNIHPIEWASDKRVKFDAFGHPEISICAPTIYTFPFFLTWQRRHQWGVIPYATHNQVGVIIHREHPQCKSLTERSEKYAQHQTRGGRRSMSWMATDVRADWLVELMRGVGTKPSRRLPPPKNGDSPAAVHQSTAPLFGVSFAAVHQSATLFAVDAYLYKDLVPLAFATLGLPDVAARFPLYAEELNLSEIKEFVVDSDENEWPRASAVIVDRAMVKPEDLPEQFTLLTLPHGVYVPVGIGYSVLAYPMLYPKGQYDLARELARIAGSVLVPAKDELARLGIDLNERLWEADVS